METYNDSDFTVNLNILASVIWRVIYSIFIVTRIAVTIKIFGVLSPVPG